MQDVILAQAVQIVQVVLDVIVSVALRVLLVHLHAQVANLVQVVIAVMIVEFVMHV